MKRQLHFKNYTQFLIVFILITVFSEISAKTTTSVQDGDWFKASTWDNGVPANGDIVIISAGDTVICDKDLKLLELYVYSGGFLNITSKNLEATIIYVYDGGKIETTKGIKIKDDSGSITIEGTIIAKTIKLDDTNQNLVVADTGVVTISDEFKAKESDASITIAGAFTSKKFKLDKENQTLIVASTGTLSVSDEFNAEKSETTITIVGSLSSDKDLKLDKDNDITGSGSVTAEKYSLSDGSTIYGICPPIDNNTVLTATFVWTGGASSESWSTPGNWYSGLIPNATSNVKIPASGITYWPTIVSTECYAIESLTIESDQNGTGSLIINGGSLTINNGATVESYIPSDDWHIISTPVSGQDMGPFADGNNLDMFSGTYDLAPYNEGYGGWDPFDVVDGTTNEFTKAKGYIMRLPQNDGSRVVTYSGNSIYSGAQTIDINSNRNGWNSVGNPYTSAIRMNAATNSFLATNAAQLSSEYGGLYFWDNITKDYITIGSGGSDIINFGQGFVIKCKEGGNGTITFSPNMQVHTSTVSLKSVSIELPEIDLFVKAGDLLNTTNVKFINNMTNGLDPGYDVGKLKGNSNIALYTKLVDGESNIDFGVQALPDVTFQTLTIPVGLDLTGGGNAKFYIETSSGFPEGAEVYLEDTELQILTKLNEENSNYEVSLSGLKGAGRFNLVIKNYNGNSITTNTQKIKTLPRYYVFARNKLIFVNGQANKNTRISLYSMDGTLWHQNYAENLNQNKIDGSNLSAGIYILQIEQNGTQQSLKVILTEN